MDLTYLLHLQEFRQATNDLLTPFMLWISHFAVSGLIMVPAIIYWCVDKKKGLYIIFSGLFSVALNTVIKLTACVYRPWIREPMITPPESALGEAIGYSFPSGHSMTATPVYGGIAVSFGKEKKWLTWLCIVLTLITLFSRNYLGLHTPQDVVVGMLLGLLVLYVFYRYFAYIDLHPEKEDLFLIIGALAGIAGLFYITFKSYPMDYVNGQLLVDPEQMKIGGYGDLGQFVVACIGRLIEKKYIRFEVTGVNKKGILLGLAGIIPVLLIHKLLPVPLAAAFGDNFGCFLERGLMMLVVIALWPLLIKLTLNKSGQKKAPAEA